MVQVNRGFADLSIGQSTFSYPWQRQAHLSPSMYQREMGLLVKIPDNRNSLWTIIYPFRTHVWTSTLVALLIAIGALVLVDYASGPYRGPWNRRDLFCNFAVAWGALINENVSARLVNLSTSSESRVLVLAIWLPMSFLLCLAYQTNLLASLIHQDAEKPLDTFQDILDYPDMVVYVMKFSLSPQLMKTSIDPSVRKVFRDQVEPRGLVHSFALPQHFENWDFFAQISDPSLFPLDLVMEGKAAMSSTDVTIIGARHLFRRGKHLSLGSLPCGYYFSLNFPLKPRIDALVLWALESGVHGHLLEMENWRAARHGLIATWDSSKLCFLSILPRRS